MGGVLENVTKRYRGGWVGELKRYVTLVLKIRPRPTDKYKYCCLDC